MPGEPKILPARPTGGSEPKKVPELVPGDLSLRLLEAPWIELRKLDWKPGFQVFLPNGNNYSVTAEGLEFALEGLGLPDVPKLLDYAWCFSEVVLDMRNFSIQRVFTRNRRIREDRLVDKSIGGVH